MTEIVPLKKEHLERLYLQEAQRHMIRMLSDDYGMALEETQALTLLQGDRPLACVGIVYRWEGCAAVWSLLSENIGSAFVRFHRRLLAELDAAPYRRVEMTVKCFHPEGHRWARMLGFEMEAPCMRAYCIDGEPCALYARIRQ